MVKWGVEKLEGVSLGAVGYMLRDCAWCEVKKAWMMEGEGRSELGMVMNLMEGGCVARCVCNEVCAGDVEGTETNYGWHS